MQRLWSGLVNTPDAAQREPMDWFPRVWQSMTEEQQTRVRDKARWEHMPLMAVLIDWPTLAPVGLRDLIPAPEHDNSHGYAVEEVPLNPGADRG